MNMMKENETKVKRILEKLMVLRTEAACNNVKVCKEILDVKGTLQEIFEEEEKAYVETHFQDRNVIAIEDAELNALFEAIDCLNEKMTYPKLIAKNLDDTVMKLKYCIKS